MALVLSLTPADPTMKTKLGQFICQGRGTVQWNVCINWELPSTVLFVAGSNTQSQIFKIHFLLKGTGLPDGLSYG